MIQLIAILAYLMIIVDIATLRPAFKRIKSPMAKTILGFTYGFLICLFLDDYRGGIIADTYNLNGADVLVFGRLQTIIEATIIITVLVVQFKTILRVRKA